MLSPGEFWKRVPKDPATNLRYRKFVLERCRKNKALRKALKEACSQDILFYVNTFAWTYNPKSGKVIPFVTWDCQDVAFLRILDHIHRQKDLVIEKSRDMGASWICITAFEWLWHFQPWVQLLLVSREGELVDGKSPDALFWKIDFLHRFLPGWLMPAWNPTFHRTKRYLENPETNSTMTGQATTEKIGIGGRATAILLDEFSRVDRDFEVRDGTADTADCRIFNSTHTGESTAFYGLTTNGVTPKMVLHWSQHPMKGAGAYRWNEETKKIEPRDPAYHYPPDFDFIKDNRPVGGPFPGLRSPWYDNECIRRNSSRAIAMDLDIDVTGTKSLFFDPLTIRRLVGECVEPYWQGEIAYDRDTGRPVALVPHASGHLKLWCRLDKDGKPPPGIYAFGCDVAAGTGATPSCGSGVECQYGTKVVEYVNSTVDPKDFACVMTALCWLFKSHEGVPAMLCWEIPGPGLVFGKEVLTLGFRHVYYRSPEISESVGQKESDRPGWLNTVRTAEMLLSDYRTALATRRFINYSPEALKECLMFEYNGRSEIVHSQIELKDDPSGSRANHGDRVIADALANRMAEGKGIRDLALEEAPLPPSSLAWRRQFAHNRHTKLDGWGR